MENRNVFTIQYVTKLTWDRNPGNAQRGANIVQYNIYRKRSEDTTYSLYDTTAAEDQNIYYDRLGTTRIEYQYTVTAVDDQGRESDISYSAILIPKPPRKIVEPERGVP
jgi:fibronectin type 3 domain-containing protein